MVRFEWSGQHRCVVIADTALRGALWQAEEDRVAHRSPGQSMNPGIGVLRASILERKPLPEYEARALVE